MLIAFDRFHDIKPVVKPPTLGGAELIDSTLILDCAETLSLRSLISVQPVTQVGAGLDSGGAISTAIIWYFSRHDDV
ncbi:hypothetical protein ACPRNU_00210 [Chromobacterium vaccinii]|uniref:hypothetical protein n=1 Tax=Chromobacterium vaccinii TaxID=1108595 RepID=UPI003C7365A0